MGQISATALDAPGSPEAAEPTERPLIPLTHPADGVPPVLEGAADVADLAARLAVGRGPVAVDAERASGYRYGQRAYLVQFRRDGAGTALVDPIAVPELTALAAALRGTEWVVHAATQDLPCLAELGLAPDALFDTELAGRLLGRPRVGLAALVAEELGLYLAKEHSAVDWSHRPLPEPWLRYAALDVEVLLELRDALAAHLERAGKLSWALEEFEAVRTARPRPPLAEPWRRVGGLHHVRDARRLAVVRELWLARDEIARSRDVTPGRILPDVAIVAAARALPRSVQQLANLQHFTGRGQRRRVTTWHDAIERALALPDSALPDRRPAIEGPPPIVRAWAEKNPAAAARLESIRATVRAVADRYALPQENLLAPDLQRRLAWEDTRPEDVRDYLSGAGARRWQVELVSPALTQVLRRP